jgi:VWFA-related protein
MRKAFAVLLAFAAAGVSAQVNEQITVNVVEVPVYVSRNGQTVSGLTKDDFVLTVNGKPQSIDYFDVIVNDTMTADAPAQPQQQIDVDRRRMIVLLFDLSQSSHFALKRAQEAAGKFVQDAPRGDVFAVATLTRDGVDFALPFMNDRAAIRQAVATLSTRKARDVFGIATEITDRKLWSSETHADTSAVEPLDRIWDVPSINRLAFQESEGAQLNYRVEASIAEFEGEVRMTARRSLVDHVGELATRLSPLSGIKHVVLLSEGSAFANPAADAGTHAIVTPLAVRESLQKMHKRFREASVILDAVDTGGTTAPWCNDCGDASYSAFSTLHSMSLDTGGTVARALPALRKAQRVTYILAFRPSREAVAAEDNAIEVKLRKAAPMTEVRYRRTWTSAKPLNGADEGLFLADVMVNDIPQNGMTISLGTSREADKSVVTATVPGREILALGNALLSLEAFVYIFDAKGQVAEWVYRKSRLDLVRGRDALSSEPYVINARTKLAPGKYVAKVLLRAVESDATGFARTEFTVN